MKGFRLLLVLLAAVVVMVPRVSKAETSDFKATVSITESIQTPGTAPCFSVGTISGAGLASQAGKITIASVDCINPMDPTFTVFSFASDQLVMTAANGDKIFATYGGTFTLQGNVSADCSFYNGSSSNHTLDLGTIGIRTGDNENVTVAFNQAGTATAHVDTATAGCNTHNTVTIEEANAGQGLVNSDPGAYDSAQFTAHIPYALNASWTGVDETTTTGFTKTLAIAASSSGENSSTGGAWRSAFNMDISVPPQSLGLVAGNYSDQITVTLAVD